MRTLGMAKEQDCDTEYQDSMHGLEPVSLAIRYSYILYDRVTDNGFS